MSKCQYCGSTAEHPGVCPTVKSIEYFASGKVKRVEFKCAPDYAFPLPSSPQPQPTWPMTPTWWGNSWSGGTQQ